MQRERISKYYNTVVVEDLLIAYNYTSIMQLPRYTHTTLNTTSKNNLLDKKAAVYTLAACFLLTGQKSIPSRAHNSIAGFHLRKGNYIGCKVTLRRKGMYHFIDKLLTLVLPRVQNSWRENEEERTFSRVLKTDNKSVAIFLTAFLGGVSVAAKKVKRDLGSLTAPTAQVAHTTAQVAHIGVSNFLFFPEVESFFSLFADEYARSNPSQGFDLTCHFSIPRTRTGC